MDFRGSISGPAFDIEEILTDIRSGQDVAKFRAERRKARDLSALKEFIKKNSDKSCEVIDYTYFKIFKIASHIILAAMITAVSIYALLFFQRDFFNEHFMMNIFIKVPFVFIASLVSLSSLHASYLNLEPLFFIKNIFLKKLVQN
jgi:hypothetical protein